MNISDASALALRLNEFDQGEDIFVGTVFRRAFKATQAYGLYVMQKQAAVVLFTRTAEAIKGWYDNGGADDLEVGCAHARLSMAQHGSRAYDFSLELPGAGLADKDIPVPGTRLIKAGKTVAEGTLIQGNFRGELPDISRVENYRPTGRPRLFSSNFGQVLAEIPGVTICKL